MTESKQEKQGFPAESLGTTASGSLKLDDGSRIAVLGGGPAGSFFTYFLMAMAERLAVELRVDIYENRDYTRSGAPGCNMCGGIVSESLVQALAAEGIILPDTVVRRGVDSYILHMDVGSVKIMTPLEEKRIGAVYRGAGPKGITSSDWESFDGYLLSIAREKGAHLVNQKVERVLIQDGRPRLETRNGNSELYDLLVVATGVNTATLKLFQDLPLDYTPPRTTRTFICEYRLGRDVVGEHLGNSMHTYLLTLPRLEFAAIIPKGDYATVCMLGERIDQDLVNAFMNTPVVKNSMPPDWDSTHKDCRCSPKINVRDARRPFADRILFIGDCGVSRLYKDGIGAAYRTSKAAAKTVLFQGVTKEDLKKHFWPACRTLRNDNTFGKLIFLVVGMMQKLKPVRKGILRMVIKEQAKKGGRKRMSTVLWDMFTGSAPYREVLMRTFHPGFIFGLAWHLIASHTPWGRIPHRKEART
jgi:flavin-dependent dehydrogenase